MALFWRLFLTLNRFYASYCCISIADFKQVIAVHSRLMVAAFVNALKIVGYDNKFLGST